MPDRPCFNCRIVHGFSETCSEARQRVARAAQRTVNRKRRGPPTMTVPTYDPAIDNPEGRKHVGKMGTSFDEPIGPDGPKKKAPAKKAKRR